VRKPRQHLLSGLRYFQAHAFAKALSGKLPGKSFELPVMGTFEVSGGKINAWLDYFDMNQFTSLMG